MNGSKTSVLSVLLLVAIAFLASSVSALNATINFVKVDGDELTPGLNTTLALERDNTFPVRVSVTALEDVQNAEIEVMISGYDHNDRVSDTTEVFDMEANVTYSKNLELRLPRRADLDQYMLRVYIRDRVHTELQQDFYILVSTMRHDVKIRSVDVDPATAVEQGRSVRAVVDVKNYGQRDEDDVKVEFLIPELGLKSLPDYMSLESQEAKTSEELYVRVPACAETGSYDAQVRLSYDDGDEVQTQNLEIEVVESGSCPNKPLPVQNQTTTPVQPTQQERTVITVSSQSQDVTAGEGGAIYGLTFTNSGNEAKTFVVSVSGADDWATVKVSPLQTVTIGGGESKSVYVYVSAKETAQPGLHSFTVDVKDASGNVVKQIPLSANVLAGEGEKESSGLKRALEIGLIVLVVILVIVALIVFFTRKKEDEEEEAEDEISGQTYY